MTTVSTDSMPSTTSKADAALVRALAGRFVVFEGPDGSGKSTQFERFVRLADGIGLPCCTVREPGGTSVGERIRDVLLDPALAGMGVRCETLLYMASRAELVERCVIPALQRGEMVLADRFVSSTLAYQGAAGGVPASEISAVARLATRGLVPDIVVVFDIDEESAAKRLSPLLDRMEAKGSAFHRSVRAGYLDQVKADPSRYLLVDASKTADQVWADLLDALRERVPQLPALRKWANAQGDAG